MSGSVPVCKLLIAHFSGRVLTEEPRSHCIGDCYVSRLGTMFEHQVGMLANQNWLAPEKILPVCQRVVILQHIKILGKMKPVWPWLVICLLTNPSTTAPLLPQPPFFSGTPIVAIFTYPLTGVKCMLCYGGFYWDRLFARLSLHSNTVESGHAVD